MLYRIVFTTRTTGDGPLSTQAVAEVLGASERNNRRDEIGGVMLFHNGQVAQMVEGMRIDLDRLMVRLAKDDRHKDLRVAGDRPVMHRKLRDPMRLCTLSTRQVEVMTEGRGLDELSGVEIERLMTACLSSQADAA